MYIIQNSYDSIIRNDCLWRCREFFGVALNLLQAVEQTLSNQEFKSSKSFRNISDHLEETCQIMFMSYKGVREYYKLSTRFFREEREANTINRAFFLIQERNRACNCLVTLRIYFETSSTKEDERIESSVQSALFPCKQHFTGERGQPWLCSFWNL